MIKNSRNRKSFRALYNQFPIPQLPFQSSAMANLKRKIRRLRLWWRENGSTYVHLFIHIVISSGLICSNKLLLSSKLTNFQYPLGLGFLQMTFSSVLCFIVMKVMKIRKVVKDPEILVKEEMSMRRYAKSILGVGGLLSFSLWMRNGAYLYISFSFMQVLKTTLPIAVFALEMTNVWCEAKKTILLLYKSAIIVGVIVASYGEASFSWPGVFWQMGSVIMEAVRIIVIQDLVVEEGVRLNSVCAMYYISLCSSFCLFVLWICLEMPFIDSFWPWGLSTPCLLILNCLLMFALNLQACLVISHTSALRFAQAKAVRDLVVVHLLPSLLADRRLTPTSNIGYNIALASLLIYYPLKEKALTNDEREKASEKRMSWRSMPPSPVTLKEKARVRFQLLLGDLP